MVAAIKWEQANSADSLTLEGNGAALSNDTIVEANDNAYNGATDLDTYGWLEVTGTWTVAPSDNTPTLDIYITEAPDGTNYSSAPVTGGVDCHDQFLISIPVRKVTSAQRKVVPIPLSPQLTKFYVDNQTGQTLPAGWTLKLFKNNPESQ
jgi:hypothetical protein